MEAWQEQQKRFFTSLRARGARLARSRFFLMLVCILLLLLFGLWRLSIDAEQKYQSLLSVTVYDRHGVPISVQENSKGHYVYAATTVPPDFSTLLIAKEDRFFYQHPGINPFSTVRALFHHATDGHVGGSSTLTQQLAKNLLGTEVERNVKNKVVEAVYALSLELFLSKEEILTMYTNTAYLGQQVQGFETASYAYFDKPLRETTFSEQIALLTTLSHPSTRNPWEVTSAPYAAALAKRLVPQNTFIPPTTTDNYSFRHPSYFELQTAGVSCEHTCATTIDAKLTGAIRDIMDRHIENNWSRNIKNGAVVVLRPQTGEVLALVGSRNPESEYSGNQINMAIAPRPIGSTIKPLLYAKGFELGLRPYTTVEDREYRYPIATGFSLYPKNYDGHYYGKVTLHEALSNSLNVPSVKTLEYIGLDTFYHFLSDDLDFSPLQPYDNYQYGIALGGLEMDLLTLTHYFTLFPRQGTIAPLKILADTSENFQLPPQSDIEETKTVFAPEYVELVHAILSDRYTGVNQFGLSGNLNLTESGYGVKTGTSRDFHDSWVVGYTQDFVVGVWLGNSENEPLDQVTGSTGAGAVWREVMEYLFQTPYYTGTTPRPKHLERFFIEDTDEWGIAGDVVSDHRDLLTTDSLIFSVHEGDIFALTDTLTIPLRARKEVSWTMNGKEYGLSRETSMSPTEAGRYEIAAYDKETGVREIVVITVVERE